MSGMNSTAKSPRRQSNYAHKTTRINIIRNLAWAAVMTVAYAGIVG